LFFLRDVFLLGSASERVRLKLLVYAIATSVYLATAVVVTASLTEARAAESIKSPAIWVPSLGMHAVLCLAAVWFKRRFTDSMWLIALAPAPVLILAIVAASRGAARLFVNLSGFQAGLMVSFGWIALVCAGALGFRACYRGWKDDGFVGDLAMIASWTGIWIIPLSGVAQFG